MNKRNFEIIGLTAVEVLATLNDFLESTASLSERPSLGRALDYVSKIHERGDERRGMLKEKIKYLKRHGLIETFVSGKDRYFELTSKGFKKANHFKLDSLEIDRPNIWDGKWRIVIFDVPNKRRHERDLFRSKLVNLGFQKIQESVYVYPFECADEVYLAASAYLIENNVLIAVSEIIQGEEEIIHKFIDNNTLTEIDLKKVSK